MTTRRKKGSGTIEDTRDGRKRVRITTAAGRRSLGVVNTQEEAEALLGGVRAELLSEEHVEGLTLGAWGARWLDRREGEGTLSIETDRNRWDVHVAKSALADLPIASITRADVLEWLDVMCAKQAKDRRGRRKLSKNTIQNALNLLRGAFEAAVQRCILTANPAAGVRVPKRVAPTVEPWTYLTLEEQEALWRCEDIPRVHRLMLQFAVGTGLREGEMFNLHLRDLRVDGDRPEIVIRYGSRNKGPKSTKGKPKIRYVPLFGLGLEAARAWLDELPRYAPKNPHGLVFPGPKGARRQKGKHLHVTQRVNGKPRPVDPLPEYLAAAGIVQAQRHDGRHVRWHDLRHTCAAALVSGMWGRRWSLEEVKGLLGHSSISITERYAHLADSALRAAAAATHKPATSPRRPVLKPLRGGLSARNDSQSHLRDLNPRPTVYETVALPLS